MLIVVGMPLLLLELGLGQKLRVGAAGAWKKVRLIKLTQESRVRLSDQISDMCFLLKVFRRPKKSLIVT